MVITPAFGKIIHELTVLYAARRIRSRAQRALGIRSVSRAVILGRKIVAEYHGLSLVRIHRLYRLAAGELNITVGAELPAVHVEKLRPVGALVYEIHIMHARRGSYLRRNGLPLIRRRDLYRSRRIAVYAVIAYLDSAARLSEHSRRNVRKLSRTEVHVCRRGPATVGYACDLCVARVVYALHAYIRRVCDSLSLQKRRAVYRHALYRGAGIIGCRRLHRSVAIEFHLVYMRGTAVLVVITHSLFERSRMVGYVPIVLELKYRMVIVAPNLEKATRVAEHLTSVCERSHGIIACHIAYSAGRIYRTVRVLVFMHVEIRAVGIIICIVILMYAAVLKYSRRVYHRRRALGAYHIVAELYNS